MRGQRARDAVGAHRLPERSTGVCVVTSRSLTAASIAAAISCRRRSQEWAAAARERSARRSRAVRGERLRRAARAIPAASAARAHLRHARERGQRRRDHRQAGGQVLVDLHREDALGQLVARVGDQPGVGAAQHVGQLARRRAGRAGGCSARPRAPRRRCAGRPGRRARPARTTTSGRSAGQLGQQRQVELDRHDRAGEHDPRAGQRGHRRVRRPGSSARENSSVSATLGASSTLSESLRSRSRERRRARQHEVGARGEALLGGAEARGVDALAWAAMSSTQW